MASGLTLEAVATRLAKQGHRVSTSTLSAWEIGQHVPSRRSSLDAIDELELIYGVPAGALRRHVGRSRRHIVSRPAGDLPGGTSWRGLGSFRVPSVELRADVSRDAGRFDLRQVLMAPCQTVGRHELRLPRCAQDLEVHGARIGRRRSLDTHATVELIMDRNFEPGDTHTVSVQWTSSTNEAVIRPDGGVLNALLWVRFATEARPYRVERLRQHESLESTEEVVLSPTGCVDWWAVDPTPAVSLGFRWFSYD